MLRRPVFPHFSRCRCGSDDNEDAGRGESFVRRRCSACGSTYKLTAIGFEELPDGATLSRFIPNPEWVRR